MGKVLLFFVLFHPLLAFSANYFISNANELFMLSLAAGDTVTLRNGVWKNEQLNVIGLGNADRPIIIKAETEGKVLLQGNSNLKIDGEYLVVSGLQFLKGFSLRQDVIIFTAGSKNCRLTNSTIISYNPVDQSLDYKWISLNGSYNRIDHCFFKGKTNQGSTLVVWLSNHSNHHRIDHNYFGERVPLGLNGGETVRIGTSAWSMSSSNTIVENNIFDECDGEIEVVSNKSCKNIIRENLFFECDGTLTLRHGNDNEVVGNYFIGNQKRGTGGVRITGETQNVHHNYFSGLSGKGLRAAVSIMKGIPQSPLNGYFQVKNSAIHSNILVACEEGFHIGSGNSEKNTLQPTSVSIYLNRMLKTRIPLVESEKNPDVKFICNSVAGKYKSAGFTSDTSIWTKNELGILAPADHTRSRPFWLSEKVGVTYIQLDLNKFKVNN